MTLPSWCKIVKRNVSVYEREVLKSNKIVSAALIAELVGPRILSEEQEVMYVVLLDGHSRVLHLTEVARGGRHGLVITRGELFRLAIAYNASAIILVHNHPSGSRWPSGEDDEITFAVKETGDLLGIPLLDHVIIAQQGEDGYYSYLEMNEKFGEVRKAS